MAKHGDLFDPTHPEITGDAGVSLNVPVHLWPREDEVSHDQDIGDSNNGWSLKVEAVLNDLSIKCSVVASLHNKLHLYYANINTIFNVLFILVSVSESFLVTTDFFISISTVENNIPVKLVVQFVSFVSTVMAIFNRYLSFNVKSEKHKACELRLHDIYHSIQIQLMIENKGKRINGTEFAKWSLQNYSKFMREHEPIPDKYMERGIEQFRKERKSNFMFVQGDSIALDTMGTKGSSQVTSLGVAPNVFSTLTRSQPKQETSLKDNILYAVPPLSHYTQDISKYMQKPEILSTDQSSDP